MAKLRHIALIVSDPEASAKFFEQAFEFKRVGSARRGIYLSDGTVNLALLRVEAINGGLGIAVTKSWGMVDNRTISAVTPVDESTSDVRSMVYIGRAPGKDPARAELRATEFGREVIRQFEQDIEIWQHQRYSDPPALAPDEYEGFTAIRKWAKQFYAASQKG